MTTSPQTRLKRNAVGTTDIVFFVLSSQAPMTGIVGVSAIAITLGNGPGFPAVYVLVGLVMLLFSVGFTTMTRFIPSHGGFSTLIEAGIGFRAGAASAWVALLCYSAVQAAMYGLISVTASGSLMGYLGWNIPWWLIFLVMLAGITLLGTRNVKIGAQLLIVLVALEFLILLVFSIGIFLGGHTPEGISVADSFRPSAVLSGAPGIAIMFAIASMFGFEATTVYAAEARDPRRTVPRATYISVLVITVSLTFFIWSIIQYYGASNVVDAAISALEAGDPAVFVTAPLDVVLGGWAGPVAATLLVTSLIAALLAFHNIICRYLHSMARKELLPGGLAQTNRYHAPAVAAFTQSSLAFLVVMPFALLGMDPMTSMFGWYSGLGVIALVLLYSVTSFAVYRYFRGREVDASPWHTTLAPLLSTALMAALLVLIGSNFNVLAEASWTISVLLLGIVPIVAVIGWLVTTWTGAKPGVTLDFEADIEADERS